MNGGSTLTPRAFTWFPLVQRSRPPCRPLTDRVDELLQLVAKMGAGEPHDQLTRAAEVWNKAALIASDCGLPNLARTLCWDQHAIFDQARPLPASAAQLALQPLLNLPRQLIRERDGDGAYAMLETLYRAARDRTDALIDGRTVSLRNVTSAPDDHKTVSMLVWAALLADGTRALAAAGRWREAADRAAAHRGVGARLLDGRQVSILALAADGRAEEAAELVNRSSTAECWEHAVESLMRVLCQRAAGANPGQAVTAMLTAVLDLLQQDDPSTVVFRTRVAMTALDLTNNPDDLRLCQVRTELIAAAHRDAYAARDALAHPALRPTMTASQHLALTRLTHDSGLDVGAIPKLLCEDFSGAVAQAGRKLRELLQNPHRLLSVADG